MHSLNCHPSFLHLELQSFKQQHSNAASKVRWLSTNERTKFVVDRRLRNMNSQLLPVRSNAIVSSSLLLGVTSPPKPDITIFFITSAVMFFAFWIANFVVPDFISKEFNTDPTNGSKKSDDDDDDDDNTPIETEKTEEFLNSNTSTRIQPKNKGFNSKFYP